MGDYESDPRTACKYGSGCYRTNKDHIEKYKHRSTFESNSSERPAKKQKTENVTTPEKTNSKLDSSPKKAKEKDSSRSSKSPRSNPPSEEKKPKAKETCSHNNSGLIKEKLRSADSKKLEVKTDPKDMIKQLFLVDMPEDFYSFWEMCKSINEKDPSNSLKEVKLRLVGPFDVLAGKIKGDIYEEDLPDYLRHWRYYYDPPEFQTVLSCSDSRCFHYGYYRDDPSQDPVFVASNVLNPKNPEKNGELKIVAPNLFAAFNVYLEDLKVDPFSRMKVPKFQKTLSQWAKEHGFSLDKSVKSRKVVAKTLHGAGIVVPVDKKTDVGYRELAATNSMLKKMLKGIVESGSEEERKKFWEQLQPVITFANIANDECDFGTSLELGLDLFTYGSPLLHRVASQLLTTAYSLLNRSQFATIIQAHLENRREGGNLSVL